MTQHQTPPSVTDEMVEALQKFIDHYPMGVNPSLDEAYRMARAALSAMPGGVDWRKVLLDDKPTEEMRHYAHTAYAASGDLMDACRAFVRAAPLTEAATALSSAQARADKLEAELAEAKRERDAYKSSRWHWKQTAVRFAERSNERLARAESAESSLAAAKERVKELEGALKPFAAKADLYEANHPTSRHPLRDATQITHRLGDFRAARTALKAAGKE